VTESGLRAQAAALAARLTQLQQREVAADERLNQTNLALSAARARQQQARYAADVAAAEVHQKRGVLATAAISAYMAGGRASDLASLIQASASNFGIQQGYINSVVDTQQSAIDALRSAEARLAVEQSHLAAAAGAARADVARAAAVRTGLLTTISLEQDTLAATRGRLGRMVAHDQAVAEAEAAAAARARLEAEAAASAARNDSGVSRDAPLPAPGVVLAAAPPGASAPSGAPSPSGAASSALSYAQSVLGTPYVYGGGAPGGFDCSGLVMWAFGRAGVGLPHSAAGQWDDTVRIPYSEAQPGDLVFFYSPVDHVGIYVGNGMMIDAPYTGTVVRYDPIYWNVLDGFGRVEG
jgi:cell wall-associated NlpC family hydrolase